MADSGAIHAVASLPAAMLVRLAAVAASVLAARHPRVARTAGFAGAALASACSGLAAGGVLLGGPEPRGILLVHEASGFAIGYTLDGLAAWFMLVLSIVAIPTAIFSVGYAAHVAGDRRSAFLASAFNVLVGAVELAFAADGMVGFLFAWELMTLATAALVVTEHESRESRRAAFLYLVMSHVATGCLFAAFLVLASSSGSVSFAAMLSGHVVSGPLRDVLFLLFVVGFGIKAGIVPLHVWLPEAHPAAPSPISALMSGALIKTGIYGLVRFAAFGLGLPRLSWGVAILALGGLSSVLGVLYALMQHDLKRLLAYHSIENIGIILLGLGAGMMASASGHGELAVIGLAAALYHVLNHAVFKSLLFLGAGSVALATGTRQIEALGGLLRGMPWTGFFFLVGALAISALPPLNGFASEWLTFQSFIYGFRATPLPIASPLFPVAGALLALTSALAAACFVKAFGITFLARPRSRAAADARECSALLLVPQGWLAALCVVLGLAPGTVMEVLVRVLRAVPGIEPRTGMVHGPLAIAAGPGALDQLAPAALGLALVGGLALTWLVGWRARAPRRHVPAWGCGGVLDERTEYTATAFSKPLMMIFRAIYRPTRTVDALAEAPYFTREVRYHAEIEPTFERYLYGPLVRSVLGVAERMKVLQAGSLHAYLAYVIALVLTMVLLVWWMG